MLNIGLPVIETRSRRGVNSGKAVRKTVSGIAAKERDRTQSREAADKDNQPQITQIYTDGKG
jgi:hypothetical protein